jgi:Bacterial transcriptional activator domain
MARQDRKPGRARSGWDVPAGLGAMVVLLVLLIGPPVALITVFGLPIPHTMPSASLVTHRLEAATVLRACAVVVWLAWLQLVWCVAAEVTAAVRNVGMPRRVPLAGGMQALVHRLVTTALLVSTATTVAPALAPVAALAATPPAAAAMAPAAAQAAAPGGVLPGQAMPPALLVLPSANGGGHHRQPGPADLSQEFRPATGTANGNGTQATAASPDGGQDRWAHRTEKIYVVKPPAGRFHESLWEIAENHLGDGRRYREIFELNKDLPQPDGSMLTIASLIRPGWILRMPHDAHGPGIEEVKAGPAARHSGRPQEPRPADRPPAQGRHASAPAAVPPAQPPSAQTPPAAQTPATQTPPAQAPAAQSPPAKTPATQTPPAQAPAAQSPPAKTPAAKTPPAKTPAAKTPAASAPAPGAVPAKAPPPDASAAPAPSANGRPATGRTAPGQSAPGQSAPGRSAPAPGHAARPGPGYPLELAAAGLLAAGVLAELERRRRKQARRRPPGRQVAAPQPDAAWAEVALRLGEEDATARTLDAGLRYLSRALQRQGRTPPTVFAAHIGDDNLDLWVTPPSQDVPAPWYPVGDGQVWRLPLGDLPGLDRDQAAQGTALYPGLVTIGTDATGRVLVDLEAARGPIAVLGPGELVADALCAMATEIATSLWSDGLHLTLVGAEADLAVLAPGRVHVADSLAEALPLLEAHAAGVADALAASGARSVLAGRAEGLIPEAWVPHYLITLIPPAPHEAQRLAALGRTGHLAAGYLVAGELAGAAWTWEVTPEGLLRAPELGLDVAAQFLPAQQQAALASLFGAAGDMSGALMSAPPVDAAPAPHLAPDARMPAEVTVLGPVSVHAQGEIEPRLVPLATEIVVYLATHPAGVHPNVLARAIWPQGVADEDLDAVLDEVAYWLGTDGIGRPHLAADASGRLRLGSGVRVDWQVFLTLVAQAGQAGGPGGKGGHRAEEAKLAQALSLIEGHFLAGCGPGGYSWIVTDALEYEVAARVADAAHRLCELRLNDGDSRGAMDAVRTGLRVAPDDELLWRDLLAAAHATGQENLLYAAAGEIWTRACLDGPPEMTTETEALLDELLPTWRWTLA